MLLPIWGIFGEMPVYFDMLSNYTDVEANSVALKNQATVMATELACIMKLERTVSIMHLSWEANDYVSKWGKDN
jgi:small neutral amino acid transporter SnatA (MarC family)